MHERNTFIRNWTHYLISLNHFLTGIYKSPLEIQQRFVFENYIAFSAFYQTTSSLTAKFRLNLSHELFKTTLIS